MRIAFRASVFVKEQQNSEGLFMVDVHKKWSTRYEILTIVRNVVEK